MKKIQVQFSTAQDAPAGTSRFRRAAAGLAPVARRIREVSAQIWGENRAVELYGESDPFIRMLDKIEKFARFKEPVLITGESGVGKEYVAAACHLLSPRSEKPYEAVNCPQYTDGNITVSELFGHVKGSFTGATSDKKGHFETANGGTVFLDEVADLHTNAQTMLLRALAQQEFKPLGSEPRCARTPCHRRHQSPDWRHDSLERVSRGPLLSASLFPARSSAPPRARG